MLGFDLDPTTVLVVIVFILVAFPVHEFSHALVAYRLGDGTAKLFGRLTLNPIVHFDPVGGGLLILTAVLPSGFIFGWAKPTPVNPRNLRYGHRGEALVAAAGPISNIVLAAAAAIPLRFILDSSLAADLPSELIQGLYLFVLINVYIALFNLIPIPPLDGSKVLFGLLNPRTVWQIRPVLEQYGFLILLLGIFPIFRGNSILGLTLRPLADGIIGVLVGR